MWISVKSEMPPKGKPVLITDGKVIVVASLFYLEETSSFRDWYPEGFRGYEWEWDFTFEAITYWMLLPEFPKDEVDNGGESGKVG